VTEAHRRSAAAAPGAGETAIVAVETCTSATYPQVVHVLIETAGGVVGLGETFHRARAVEAYVHNVLAPVVLGQDGLNLARVRRLIGSRFDGGNVPAGIATIDSAAISAADIALWDLRGKVLGVSVCDLLGGRVRESIRVYNTCAGPGEGMPAPGTPRHRLHLAEPWGLGGAMGEYDDYRAMWEQPAELARALLDEEIGAMKLYTFRPAARETQGAYIGPRQLERALEPFAAIRDAVGNEIDLMVDLVFDWTLAPARRIVKALEEYDLLWIEDPLRWGARRFHSVLQQGTATPLAAFDYGVGLESYVRMLEEQGLAILRVDPQWVGGITEAVRIANLADALGIGMVFHDCTGPVNFLASTHLAVHCGNTMFQESVRGYWRLVYPRIVTATPGFANGAAAPPPGPGLGAELTDEYLALPDLRRVRTELAESDAVTTVLD
jgi:galactonate dehydratase